VTLRHQVGSISPRSQDLLRLLAGTPYQLVGSLQLPHLQILDPYVGTVRQRGESFGLHQFVPCQG